MSKQTSNLNNLLASAALKEFLIAASHGTSSSSNLLSKKYVFVKSKAKRSTLSSDLDCLLLGYES